MMKWFAEKNQLTYKSSYAIVAYFLLISFLEIMAYRGNASMSFLASRIWLFSGIALLIIFFVQAGRKLVDDIKAKEFVALIGYMILFLFFIYLTFSLAKGDLNPDATQQAAAGLASFKVRDLNYTGQAFLGYANRQYVIVALPALIFGRSIASLHLGFGALFLIGLTELFFEIREWLKNKGIAEKYALIPMYAFCGFRFIIEYYLNFEQAITPVALTILGIALFLRVVRKPDPVSIIALAWTGVLCINSYTPVLASLGLLIVFLLLRIFEVIYKNRTEIKNPKSKEFAYVISMAGIEINIILSLIASFKAGRSDRMGLFRDDVKFVKLAFSSIVEFFTDANAQFLGLFIAIFFVYMLLALFMQLKPYDFLIAGWILCVVVFANYLKGYTSYSKGWILQRAMIIIPVFITAVFFASVRLLANKVKIKKRYFVALLVLFITLGGIYSSVPHQSFVYFSYIKPMKYMFKYTSDICKEYNIQSEDEFNLVLYTDNIFQKNIQEYCKFLYPNAHTYMPDNNALPENYDRNLPTIIFGEDRAILSNLACEVQSRSFKDLRYHEEYTWYVIKSNMQGKTK